MLYDRQHDNVAEFFFFKNRNEVIAGVKDKLVVYKKIKKLLLTIKKNKVFGLVEMFFVFQLDMSYNQFIK